MKKTIDERKAAWARERVSELWAWATALDAKRSAMRPWMHRYDRFELHIYIDVPKL